MSPDGSSKPLPEEHLLKLIRGKGASASPAGGSLAHPPGGDAEGVGTYAYGSAATSSSRRWPIVAISVLSVLLLVELLVLAMEVTRPVPVIKVPDVRPTHSLAPEVSGLLSKPAPSLSSSVSREIFAAPVAQSPSKPKEDAGALAERRKLVTELISRLTLLGVVDGNPPQAIIEDKTSGKTFFVSPGQAVVEGALLDQVMENRALLKLDDETFELSL